MLKATPEFKPFGSNTIKQEVEAKFYTILETKKKKGNYW